MINTKVERSALWTQSTFFKTIIYCSVCTQLDFVENPTLIDATRPIVLQTAISKASDGLPEDAQKGGLPSTHRGWKWECIIITFLEHN